MKILFLVAIAAISFSGCLKDSEGCNRQLGDPKASANEIPNIQAYLTTNSLTATQHPSGIFYEIIAPGTGAAVKDQCSGVGVNYVGKLTNGNTFDASTSTAFFALYNLITGWRIGIPLIKAGGKIKLYIPASLGYGDRLIPGNPPYNVPIPPNSILVFEVDLVSVSE